MYKVSDALWRVPYQPCSTSPFAARFRTIATFRNEKIAEIQFSLTVNAMRYTEAMSNLPKAEPI